MIKLSYSTLNDVYQFPHSWLNKVMGAKKPDLEVFKEGKKVHRLVQDHLCGESISEVVAQYITQEFSIVEQKEFDERCKLVKAFDSTGMLEDVCVCEFPREVNGVCTKCKKPTPPYLFRGYFDGYNPETQTILEIKTGRKELWTLGRYKDSIQRKIYSLLLPEAKATYLFTALQNVELWDRVKPKTMTMEIKEKDKQEALKWILDGIKLIEEGDFTKDLNEDGKCTHFMCPYGENCLFK